MIEKWRGGGRGCARNSLGPGVFMQSWPGDPKHDTFFRPNDAIRIAESFGDLK